MSPADEARFLDFVSSRRRALRRTAYLMCGDWYTADDLVQTALTKLYVAWPRVRDAEPDAYTRRIVLRSYLDERRRPWRRESPKVDLPEPATIETGIDDRIDLRRALDLLPKRQRATLVMRFWCDASVVETADALGCSQGTVKSQTARAVTALRALLVDPELVLEETS